MPTQPKHPYEFVTMPNPRAKAPKHSRGDDVINSDLAITFRPLDDLRDDPKNVRTHPESQIVTMEALLERIGWASPLGLDRQGIIIFGHLRRIAAQRLRDRGVHIRGTPDPNVAPIVDLSHLSDQQRHELAIADNRMAELSGWDKERLAEQLAELEDQGSSLDVLGFTQDDVDALLGHDDGVSFTDVAEIPVGPVRDEFWISVRGPLPQQAAVLTGLREIMERFSGVMVELGTVSIDGEA